MVLFGLLFVLDTVAIIVLASKIAKKHADYLQSLQDERDAMIRTGLFKEVYDAYRHDEFEFSLTYDKFLFEDYYNNTIDIGIQKSNHEFFIEIDEKTISIVFDEETDHPIEWQVLMSDITTMEQLYLTVNRFIKEQSQ